MPIARFRLDSVTIEGFKAFTKEQTIQVSGKHLFLFGENGSGKSSIVEAVRWCLFGSADRPETEVQNAFYVPGECRVELSLMGPGGNWKFARRLRAGTGRSVSTISNPQGQPVLQTEVFPHMARLGPKEGTHIIFAAQKEVGRRPHADISDFDKVLYSYLRLEDIPELLDRIDDVLEEQEESMKRLAAELSEAQEEIRHELDQVTSKLEELVGHPPLKKPSLPTTEETTERIRTFVEEMGRLSGSTVQLNRPSAALLEEARRLSLTLANTSRTDLERKLNNLRNKTTEMRTLWSTQEQAAKKRSDAVEGLGKIKLEVSATLGDKTKEDLENKLATLREQMQKGDTKLLVAREARQFCEVYSLSECPVCLTKINTQELLLRIEEGISDAEPSQREFVNESQSLQTSLTKATELANSLTFHEDCLRSADKRIAEIIPQLRALIEVPPESALDESIYRPRLATLEKLMIGLEEELQSTQSKLSHRERDIEDLEKEVRFHQYRRRQEWLTTRVTTGLASVRESYAAVGELVDTLRDIRDKLQQAFDESLDRAFPHLDKMMTDVYLRLTNNVSFEKVCVRRDEKASSGRKLYLHVKSDRAPDTFFYAEDVLNGQALSALRLVPYFVFSQLQAEALEMDFLLIDDPSQSFDTSRVGLLLRELATAGSHAQLIVATHEEERFRPGLSQYLSDDDFRITRVGRFDPDTGPSLEPSS